MSNQVQGSLSPPVPKIIIHNPEGQSISGSMTVNTAPPGQPKNKEVSQSNLNTTGIAISVKDGDISDRSIFIPNELLFKIGEFLLAIKDINAYVQLKSICKSIYALFPSVYDLNRIEYANDKGPFMSYIINQSAPSVDKLFFEDKPQEDEYVAVGPYGMYTNDGEPDVFSVAPDVDDWGVDCGPPPYDYKKKLELSWPNVPEAAERTLMLAKIPNVLDLNPSFETIEFSGLGLNDAEFALLAKKIAEQKSLRGLTLNKNQLTDGCLESIKKIILSCTLLKEINLDDNRFSNECLIKFWSELPSRISGIYLCKS